MYKIGFILLAVIAIFAPYIVIKVCSVMTHQVFGSSLSEKAHKVWRTMELSALGLILVNVLVAIIALSTMAGYQNDINKQMQQYNQTYVQPYNY